MRIKSHSELSDIHNVKKFCIKISNEIDALFHSPTKISYYGGKVETNHYVVHFESYSKDVSIFCSISLYYPIRYKLLYESDYCKNPSNKKLERIMTSRQKLQFASILDLIITPQGLGYGTKLMNRIIPLFRIFPDITCILLHPQDDQAERFWTKLGFRDNFSIEERKLLKKYPACAPRDMILELHK